MKLTEAMRFLSPAIDKHNKLMPVLEHVCIRQGYAVAYDGMLAMAAPVGIPLSCCPNGTLMQQAVKRFGDEFAATQKPNGDLFFQGKGFSVTIPCTTDPFPMPDFGGTPVMHGKGLLANFKKLIPFVQFSEDLPWQGSLLIRNSKMYATCGHTLAFCPVEVDPSIQVQIPLEAAEAIVAIGEDPEYIAKSEDRFVAVFSEGRYLSCPPIHTSWPKLEKIGNPSGDCGILPGLFKAIHDVEPFGVGEGKINFFLRDGFVCSSRDNTGAKANVEGLAGNWSWIYPSVKLIEKHCKHLRIGDAFAAWSGDGIEGRVRLGKIA